MDLRRIYRSSPSRSGALGSSAPGLWLPPQEALTVSACFFFVQLTPRCDVGFGSQFRGFFGCLFVPTAGMNTLGTDVSGWTRLNSIGPTSIQNCSSESPGSPTLLPARSDATGLRCTGRPKSPRQSRKTPYGRRCRPTRSPVFPGRLLSAAVRILGGCSERGVVVILSS